MKPNGCIFVSFYALKSKIIVKHLHYIIYKKSTQLENVELLFCSTFAYYLSYGTTTIQHGNADKVLSDDNK